MPLLLYVLSCVALDCTRVFTYFDFVRLFTCMFQLMSIKCTLASGCKSTNFVLVRFLSRVKSAMFTKILWQGKTIYHRLDRCTVSLPSEFCLPGDPLSASPPWGLVSLGPRLPGASPPWGLASLGIRGHPLLASLPWGLFDEGGFHILEIFLSLSSFSGRGSLPLPFPWSWVGFGSWTLGNQSLTG